MQRSHAVRPLNTGNMNYPKRYDSVSQSSPRSLYGPHDHSSRDSSPSHSFSRHHNSSEASPPSVQTSNTSWAQSWFQDESRSPSNFDHDSNLTLDDSCQIDSEDWFARFRGDLDISDDPPTMEALAEAGDVPVYDAAGNSRQFKSLFSVGDVVGDRQLIIFIRHFYCGACQAYVKALTQSINMQTYFTMAIPTSIIIVGCGSPELIRQYKANTQCPFPIFADPTRQVFKSLGMGLTLNLLGSKRPEYMKEISARQWLTTQAQEMGHQKGFRKVRGGNMLQIGGEFLFQDGEVAWCHRMRNMRGHAEIDVIRRVLQIED